jgi:hypothetical protein
MQSSAPTATPKPSKAAHYVDNARLAERIRDYRQTGVLSEALSLDLLNIARGVHDRYQFSPDREDFAAECWIHLATQAPLKRVDPDRNPFSFFTRCVITFGRRRRNKWFKQLREAAEYREDLIRRYGAELLTTEDVGDFGEDAPSVYDTDTEDTMSVNDSDPTHIDAA